MQTAFDCAMAMGAYSQAPIDWPGTAVCRREICLQEGKGSAYGEIYTWKDSRGTAHYTNSEYDIPERYRAKAKVLNLGIVEKKDNCMIPLPVIPEVVIGNPAF